MMIAKKKFNFLFGHFPIDMIDSHFGYKTKKKLLKKKTLDWSDTQPT
jgi:hypothetical protein